MATLPSTQIVEDTLRHYGVPSPSGLAGKISAYIELLLKWNRRISLTTVTDPLEIVRFHFGESLFATSQLEIGKSRLADVGSGAGFPGLPLAMAIPQLQVVLIESNRKKCAFLAEIIRLLELSNTTVYEGRMESLVADSAQFDFVAARALGQFDRLLAWAQGNLAERGQVLLWLGESDCATISSRPDWLWEPSKLIPGSSRRYLLAGSPIPK
jgi:16S rRNA (guanine527-N7)-methyltransferase